MPLLDHFHPPLSEVRHWEGFHARWASALVDELNLTLLPPGYFAEPLRSWGMDELGHAAAPTFPDAFEVHVFAAGIHPRLVAAIELASPTSKGRADRRRAFAARCAGYLSRGAGTIIVDVVTNQEGNLHNEVVRLTADAMTNLPPSDEPLYAAAYRAIRRDGAGRLEVWLEALAVGKALPIMPLWLKADLCLPINLETTYADACRRLRLS